jgi:hypothetical protein
MLAGLREFVCVLWGGILFGTLYVLYYGMYKNAMRNFMDGIGGF